MIYVNLHSANELVARQMDLLSNANHRNPTDSERAIQKFTDGCAWLGLPKPIVKRIATHAPSQVQDRIKEVLISADGIEIVVESPYQWDMEVYTQEYRLKVEYFSPNNRINL